MEYYFIIGIIYAVINGAIRKIDTDGDWLLPLAWIIVWPIGLASLLVGLVIKLIKTIKLKLKNG